MKGKLIVKALLVSMSLLLAISALASCAASQEEFETLKENVSEIESLVDGNTIKIETLETKEVVAELKALADSIKNTADAAATQTALAEAITKLEAADSTNAASIKAALDEVKAALEASLKANGDADAATKTALEEAIASVKKTADAAATAAALEEVKAALDASDKAGAEAAAKALAEAKKALDDAIKANSDADAAVKAEINAALELLQTADATNKQEISDALAEAIGNLEAADINIAYNAKLAIGEVKVLLNQKVDELKGIDADNKDELKGIVEGTKDDLQKKIDKNAEDIKVVNEDLEQAKNDLVAAETNLSTRIDGVISDLQELEDEKVEGVIADLKTVKTDLETMIADEDAKLKKIIDDNAGKIGDNRTDIDELIKAKTELNTIIGELQETVNANKTAAEQAVDKAKTELKNKIDGLENGDVAANANNIVVLDAALTALGNTVGTNKTNADDAINGLNAAIEALKNGDVKTNADAIASLTTTLGELTAKVNTNADTAQNAINDAISALENGAVANNTSAIGSLRNDVDALYTSDEVDKAIETAITTLKGTVTGEYNTAIETAKATIKGEYTAAIAELTDEKTGIAAVVTAAYEMADKALSDRLDKLQTSHGELSTKVTELEKAYKDADTAINAEITAIKNKLDELGANIDLSIEDFVEGFDLVTKVLQGTATLTVENFTDDADLTVDGALTAQQKYDAYIKYTCTLDSFTEKVNDINAKAAWYRVEESVSDKYDTFVATVETVRFYLTRATSVDSLVKYFIDFNNAYEALPTPAESFELAIKAIEDNKSVTNNADCYSVAYNIMQEIEKINNDTLENGDPNTANDIVLDGALVERYNNIVAAYENLVAAYDHAKKEVAPAISAIDSTITWTVECKTEINNADEKYTALEGYFTESFTKYYTDITAQSVLESSTDAKLATLTEAKARMIVLDEAQGKVAELKAHNAYDQSQVAQPIYTSLSMIDDLDKLVEDWKDTYSLESENVEIMLGNGVYDNIDVALEYATVVDGFNTTHDKDDVLEKAIEDLNKKELVLYTDKGLAEELRGKLEALKKDLNGDDANLDAIIGLSNITAFEAVEKQIDILDTANTNISKILVQMDALKVDFFKAQTMEQYKDNVLTECQIAGITYKVTSEGTPSHTGDANFDTIASAAIAKYDLWMGEYNGLVAEVVAVYNDIKDIIAETSVSLADGNAVLGADTKLYDIKVKYNLGDAKNVYLPVDGGIYLSDLVDMVAGFLKDYRTMAIDAASDAENVNELIEKLPNDATKLNNYTQIKTAYDAYTAWAEKHLNGDDIANVQEMVNDASATGEFYRFVTIDNYNKLIPLWETADETYKAAETAFAEVEQKLDVVDTATIYSANDFAVAFEAYKSYIELYYADGVITNAGANGDEGFFDEKAQKEDLDADYAEYHNKLQTLETNAADVLKKYAELYAIYGNDDTTGIKLGQNLNYYTEVGAMNEALNAWLISTEYGLEEGKLVDLEGIYKKDSTTDTYALVTAAKAEYIRTAYATMNDYYNGNSNKGIAGVIVSADALEALYADLAAWDIHDAENFATALDEYQKHIDLYYDGNVTVNSGAGIDSEFTAYNEFLIVKEAFDTKLESAQADMLRINEMLDSLTLDDITVDTIATYTAVTDLKDAISNYKDNYGCELKECAICGGISAENQLNIEKADVKAQYVAIYAAELQAVDGDVYKTADLNAALNKSNKYLDTVVVGGTTTADGALANAKSELDAVKANWQ